MLSHGVRPVAYKQVGGSWERRSTIEPKKTAPTPAITANVPAESVGGCNEVSIPRVWAPGRYRIAFELELFDPGDEDVVLRPWGYFQVLPRADAQ
jgi:hypothetical protein